MKSKLLTDYLPIKNPLDYKSDIDFYNDIVKYLIEDIVKLADTGIPIDLDRVKELDKQIDEIIKEHTDKLLNNKIIKYFSLSKIKHITQDKIKAKVNSLDNIKLAAELNLKRTKHINILVDVIVDELIKDGRLKPNFKRLDDTKNWTTKKLKDIQLLTNSLAVSKIITKDYNSSFLNPYKVKAEQILYKESLLKYQKKIEDIKSNSSQFLFNPKSSVQIKELFNYIGLKSRFKTEKGSDSFNKTALLELLDTIKKEWSKYE